MTAPHDSIFVRDLEVETLIGIHPWERKLPQTLVFDLELGTDAARAAAQDAIGDALDYDAVAQRVVAFAAANHCNLLETLAERTAEMLHAEFGVTRVTLTLRKPGALRDAREVGVRIERRWT